MILPDSGERRQFESGAVRDIAQGKGRCDLLPLGVIGEWLNDYNLVHINEYLYTGDEDALWAVFRAFSRERWEHTSTALLEVAKHFEDGAVKYGDRNWEKGIPVHCYIDSAVRHYLKFRRGDNDEPHDRAFMWNILCAIWTQENHPELIDIPAGKTVSEKAAPNSPTREEMRDEILKFCRHHSCDNCPCIPDADRSCFNCVKIGDLIRNYEIVVKEHNANERNSCASNA